MSANLLVTLAPLTLTAVCLVGLVMLWARVFRRPRHAMPSCGKCGYGVYGAASMRCSECGSDFRHVGIDTAKQRGAVRPAVFAILWTLLLPLPAAVAIVALIEIGPRHYQTFHSLELTPRSGTSQLASVTVEHAWSTSNARSPGPDPAKLDVTVRSSVGGGWASFDLDLPSFTFESFGGFTGMRRPAGTPMTEAVLLELFAEANLDAADAEVRSQAAELLQLLQTARAQHASGRALSFPATPGFSVQNNSWSNAQRAAWWSPVVISGAVAFWVAGFVLFAVVRRRQRRTWERELASQPALPGVASSVTPALGAPAAP